MKSSIVSVGVDLGGTWVRLEGVDAKKRRVRSLKAIAPAVKDLPAFLKRALRRWTIQPQHLAVGSRGVWSLQQRKHLQKALKGLAAHVTVMSDVEAAWQAAFERLGQGVMVIAGTGSIAYARDSRGRSQRAGGLGPALGDEGSAFWIGKHWLEGNGYKPHFARSRKKVRDIAALAPAVWRQAQKGHVWAHAIIHIGAARLASLALEACSKLSFSKTIPVSWSGSVLENPGVQQLFRKFLREQAQAGKKRIRFVAPRMASVTAMARFFS